MDLEEARISLGSYADQLDVRCGLHRLAVGLAGEEKRAGQTEPRAAGLLNQTIAELRRLQNEALVLCILFDEAIVQEAHRFVRFPLELAKVFEAKNRVTSLLQQAGALLQEHDQRESKKNAPPKENEIVDAIRAFMEKRRLEEEPNRVESTSNSHS
jgi:hypothetical protein